LNCPPPLLSIGPNGRRFVAWLLPQKYVLANGSPQNGWPMSTFSQFLNASSFCVLLDLQNHFKINLPNFPHLIPPSSNQSTLLNLINPLDEGIGLIKY
jgi:hypothetical protein